jgi:putative membrane protein
MCRLTLAVLATFTLAFAPHALAQEATKEKQPSASEAKKGALAGNDAKLAREIAQADMAEVAAGKLGASKASSGEVKKFAQHMVDDHGQHLSELRKMAQSKGMQLPAAPAK